MSTRSLRQRIRKLEKRDPPKDGITISLREACLAYVQIPHANPKIKACIPVDFASLVSDNP